MTSPSPHLRPTHSRKELRAVGGDCGAVDEARVVGDEEGDAAGNFFGFAQAACRDLANDGFADLLRHRHDHFGGNVARANSIRGD